MFLLQSAHTKIGHHIQTNMMAYFRLFMGLPGVHVIDEDVFCFTNTQAEPGNHLLRNRIPNQIVEQRIEAILTQIDHLDWFVFPDCLPTDLGRRLEARGMKVGPGGIWMLLDTAELSESIVMPEGFRVDLVQNKEMLATWRNVSATGFGTNAQIYYDAYVRQGFDPNGNVLHYCGFLQDEAVTSATLVLTDSIAGIWDVSTPLAQRGKGFGSAITWHMVREAHMRGYQQAWVWASAMGKSVYQKLGFIDTDIGIREYQWRGQTS